MCSEELTLTLKQQELY